MKKFTLRPSKTMLTLLTCVYIISAICIASLSSNINIWIMLILFLLCIVSFIINLCKILHINAQTITTLWQQDDDDDWHLKNSRNETKKGKLLGSSFISNFFLALHFKIPEKNRIIPVVIFKDALDKKAWKELRTLLATSVL